MSITLFVTTCGIRSTPSPISMNPAVNRCNAGVRKPPNGPRNIRYSSGIAMVRHSAGPQ